MKENGISNDGLIEFKNFILNFRGQTYSSNDLIILNKIFESIPILDQIPHIVRNKVI